MSKPSERGAVAVEFALLVPVLVMLLLGVMEFGRAYNAQVTLSSAAREGVRVMAIGNNTAATRNAVKNAATGLQPTLTDGNITIAPTSCAAGVQTTVKITYTLTTLTGIAGPFPMEGKGVMLCGG
ncbi:TadE/TadG family type IV pilus assembly protein [Arthrobacter sp. AL12]|uniref:TadE/TadG family type IV pilus assembly protein n=1 Tax=Arthrobacter sp. AL12 TaxID=3042241 RepID=UPI00249AD22C|nr:TadE/TadG family type IV pilus assembly protein [Arthrobacter sp. AL12]MDI3211500.1 TadE/TadG family type IV pilus assembly protein [Arthrobacter sp. AL12]